MVKFMNPHPLKIDVVKFDGKNNFGMWRCEGMDALTTLNLEDTYDWRKSVIPLLKKIGTKPYNVWFDQVLFDTRHQVSCVT